jgi:hypothetical protein
MVLARFFIVLLFILALYIGYLILKIFKTSKDSGDIDDNEESELK